MEETFERVTEGHGGKAVPVKHFYRRQYQIAGDDWRTIYYARFKDWKGKQRTFTLGSALTTAREHLMIYEARNIRREDFDLDKKKPESGMTVAAWADSYFELEEVKARRSIDRDRTLAAPIKRLLGHRDLTELCHEDLFGYKNARKAEGIIRGGKESKTKVSNGTVKNELSLLRRMVNLARDRDIKTSNGSFRGTIPEAETRERILNDAESGWLFPILHLVSTVCRSCTGDRDIRGRFDPPD